jgi:DNA-binding GntR family transcriptional regulator
MKKDAVRLAFDYIKNRIITFQSLPGVKISDEEVAKVLGTSRTPVRESLNRLVELGLVEAWKNRGFTVKIFSRKEIEDLYMLRENLECLSVKLAIQYLNREKIRTLKKLLLSYPSVMKSHDLVLLNDVDEKFHDLIASYSENKVLHETLSNLKDKIRIVRRYEHHRSGSFHETKREHEKILELMVNGRTRKAQKAMSSHILNSMKVVVMTVPERNEKV